MKEPREVELKLEMDPTNVARFKRRASATLGSPDEGARQLVSVYFDTRKHALRRRGLSLRIRQDGERRVQTLKADGGVGAGLFDRPEWESDVAGEAPDPSLFADRAAGKAIGSRGPLNPVFETSIDRTTWTLAEGRSEIEVAVDDGTISAGSAESRVAEIELELKRGRPRDLFDLARRLAGAGQLRIAAQSKSERGYALAVGGAAAMIKAGPVTLTREDSAGAAFQAIARSCFRHFRLNETALVATRDAEALHQARVAIRRLRSALSLFGPVIADPDLDRVKRELRSLSRALGEARNLDVYRARALASELWRDAEAPEFAAFVATIEADRERAYDRVVRKLASTRFRTFTIDLSAWIETGPWLTADDVAEARDQDAWGFAVDVLDRRRRKVKRKGRHLETLDPASRHRVRIDAKKLRYASEFFLALVEGGKAKRRHKAFVGALERLQACLGDLNDIETGRAMAARMAESGVAADVGDAEADREPALLETAAAAHRALADAKPFWR